MAGREYPGITPTTTKLLAWWFKTDHRTPQGATFRFYPAQRDAIETLIYLFEVKEFRRRADLLLHYAKGQKVALPTRDDFALRAQDGHRQRQNQSHGPRYRLAVLQRRSWRGR